MGSREETDTARQQKKRRWHGSCQKNPDAGRKKERTRGGMSGGGGPQGGGFISTFSTLSFILLALPCPGLSVCQRLWPCTFFLFRNKFSLSAFEKSLLILSCNAAVPRSSSHRRTLPGLGSEPCLRSFSPATKQCQESRFCSCSLTRL